MQRRVPEACGTIRPQRSCWFLMKRMAWLKRTRSGTDDTADAAEFERLLRGHVPALYRSAYRWTGAVDRAEDLVQQLLVRLYPRLAELRALDQVRPWALRVMYRIFVDELRRARASPVQFGADPLADGELPAGEDEAWLDPGPGPQELTEQQLTQERLLRAWEQLGEEHRAVLSHARHRGLHAAGARPDYGYSAGYAEVAPAPGACQTARAAGRGTNGRRGPCMKGKDETGLDVADDDFQTLRQALRRMPTPEPRAGFVERALARAAAQQREAQTSLPARLRRFATRWETWAGAALGAQPSLRAHASILLRPVDSTGEPAAAAGTDAARNAQRRRADRFRARAQGRDDPHRRHRQHRARRLRRRATRRLAGRSRARQQPAVVAGRGALQRARAGWSPSSSTRAGPSASRSSSP